LNGKTACFNGHKDICAGSIERITATLNETVGELIKDGFTRFLCGDKYGFNALAAQAVIRARVPGIKLVIVKAHGDREYDRQEEQDRIFEAADEVVCLSENYQKGCEKARNHYLVDNSDLCVVYMRDGHSDTGYTYKYAKIHDKQIKNLGM